MATDPSTRKACWADDDEWSVRKRVRSAKVAQVEPEPPISTRNRYEPIKPHRQNASLLGASASCSDRSDHASGPATHAGVRPS